MTQEIIIYNNPAEKMMWDMVMSGQYFPVIVACVVFLIIFIGNDHIIRTYFHQTYYRYDKKIIWINLIISITSAALVGKFMWI